MPQVAPAPLEEVEEPGHREALLEVGVIPVGLAEEALAAVPEAGLLAEVQAAVRVVEAREVAPAAEAVVEVVARPHC